jgi:hypothetical protein
VAGWREPKSHACRRDRGSVDRRGARAHGQPGTPQRRVSDTYWRAGGTGQPDPDRATPCGRRLVSVRGRDDDETSGRSTTPATTTRRDRPDGTPADREGMGPPPPPTLPPGLPVSLDSSDGTGWPWPDQGPAAAARARRRRRQRRRQINSIGQPERSPCLCAAMRAWHRGLAVRGFWWASLTFSFAFWPTQPR